jgi:hypothetical protein
MPARASTFALIMMVAGIGFVAGRFSFEPEPAPLVARPSSAPPVPDAPAAPARPAATPDAPTLTPPAPARPPAPPSPIAVGAAKASSPPAGIAAPPPTTAAPTLPTPPPATTPTGGPALLSAFRFQGFGAAGGLRLGRVRAGTLPATLGLQSGDELVSINDFRIADPEQALTAYARLRTADRLELAIRRNGQAMAIVYFLR